LERVAHHGSAPAFDAAASASAVAMDASAWLLALSTRLGSSLASSCATMGFHSSGWRARTTAAMALPVVTLPATGGWSGSSARAPWLQLGRGMALAGVAGARARDEGQGGERAEIALAGHDPWDAALRAA